MEYLPTAEEQEWLVDGLSGILRDRGTRQFLSMPIVEATPRFFPDDWESPLHGVDRVVRRLMQYADLGSLKAQVDLFGGDDSVAGLFLGLKGGCCAFGFNANVPGDAEVMAGVMAHEVAHAYRAVHGLRDPDPTREEWLTDITSVFLGFGILSANNSYRCRKSGSNIGYASSTTWSTQRVGYLSPQAFAYLLGIQWCARGLEDREIRRLLGQMETNQAAFVRATIDWIPSWPAENFKRLQFPDDDAPSEQVPLDEILKPLPKIVTWEQESTDPIETVGSNAGRPVFRLGQSRALYRALLGFLIAFVPSLAALRFGQPALAGLLAAGGLVAGCKVGSRERFDTCSDPGCDVVLVPGVETCPGCGGIVAGAIRTRDERLDAAEEFERNHP